MLAKCFGALDGRLEAGAKTAKALGLIVFVFFCGSFFRLAGSGKQVTCRSNIQGRHKSLGYRI